MTIEEKVGQMSQSTSMDTLTDNIKQEIRQGRWGSFLNAGSPADRAEAQRIARQESRLHIPLLFGRDVIHGYRTIFPIPLAQAASWDPVLVEQAARTAAREASAEAIRWTFAPMLDIARDPRWGRIAESPGEDPYLASAHGGCHGARFSRHVSRERGFRGSVRQALCGVWSGRRRPRLQQRLDTGIAAYAGVPAAVSGCRGGRRGVVHDGVPYIERRPGHRQQPPVARRFCAANGSTAASW